jgi:hypothetical protein
MREARHALLTKARALLTEVRKKKKMRIALTKKYLQSKYV